MQRCSARAFGIVLGFQAKLNISLVPDGSIVSYSWADSRGNAASGVTTNLTFTENGLYPVILTVTDNEGNTATALRTISVGLDACEGHATYSADDGILYIPFVDMPTVPMIGGNHTPSTQKRAMVEATLQLIDASNLFEIEQVNLRQPTVITGESNECHAVYSLDGKLHIPYVDLPLLTILNGIPIPFGVETYKADMQLIPFSDLFMIGSVTPVGDGGGELPACDCDDNTPLPDCGDCGDGDSCDTLAQDDLQAFEAIFMEPYVLFNAIMPMVVVDYDITGEWPIPLSTSITPPTGNYTAGFTTGEPPLYIEATMRSQAELEAALTDYNINSDCIAEVAGKVIRFIFDPSARTWSCSVNMPNGVPPEHLDLFPMAPCD